MKSHKKLSDNRKKEKHYISSGILLTMAKEEYTKERERADSLDSKAGFFISVIMAVATIFVPIVPFSKIVTIFTSDFCAQKCFTSVFLTTIIIAFAILILAYKKLYDAYKLTGYMRPSLELINYESNHTSTNEQINKGLCDYYKTVVDDNIKVNNQKCMSITAGLKLSGIGFLLLIISAIGMIITVGG